MLSRRKRPSETMSAAIPPTHRAMTSISSFRRRKDMANRQKMMTLVQSMLTTASPMESDSVFERWYRMRIWAEMTTRSAGVAVRPSRVSALTRSVVRPTLFVMESRRRPTPEISATGEMDICRTRVTWSMPCTSMCGVLPVESPGSALPVPSRGSGFERDEIRRAQLSH